MLYGAIPTTNDLYVGNIGIHGSYEANSEISKCEVLFSIGTRFNDRITGKIWRLGNDGIWFSRPGTPLMTCLSPRKAKSKCIKRLQIFQFLLQLLEKSIGGS